MTPILQMHKRRLGPPEITQLVLGGVGLHSDSVRGERIFLLEVQALVSKEGLRGLGNPPRAVETHVGSCLPYGQEFLPRKQQKIRKPIFQAPFVARSGM